MATFGTCMSSSIMEVFYVEFQMNFKKIFLGISVGTMPPDQIILKVRIFTVFYSQCFTRTSQTAIDHKAHAPNGPIDSDLFIQCSLCGRPVYLPALANHLRLKHSIIVSQEKLLEFYNARTKYKALKYQVFGDDESSGSDSDEELVMTDSALDRIQMMRSVFKFAF